jgi:4-hydroxy-3-polyprenylbenzoate decarboxylase
MYTGILKEILKISGTLKEIVENRYRDIKSGGSVHCYPYEELLTLYEEDDASEESKELKFESVGKDTYTVEGLFSSEERFLDILGLNSFDEGSKNVEEFLERRIVGQTSVKEVIRSLPQLCEDTGYAPIEINGTPDCQDIVLMQSDIERLPLSTLDNGSMGMERAILNFFNTRSGIVEMGFCKFNLISDDIISIECDSCSRIGKALNSIHTTKIPAAICIGGDPIYYYCAAAPLPDFIGKYAFAGFLRGRGIAMAECLTQEVDVPADSSFVVEGEFMRDSDNNNLFHITCISRRKEAFVPIFPKELSKLKYFINANEALLNPIAKFTISTNIREIHTIDDAPEKILKIFETTKTSITKEKTKNKSVVVVRIKKMQPFEALKTAHAMWGTERFQNSDKIIITDDKALTDCFNRKGTKTYSKFSIRDTILLDDCISSNFNNSTDLYLNQGFSDRLTLCNFACADATAKISEETNM